MVRVAGLKGQLREGVANVSVDGRTPSEQLRLIREAVAALAADQQGVWATLRRELADAGVVLVDGEELTAADRDWLQQLLLRHHLPGADAARHRSGASVPLHPQSRLFAGAEARGHQDRRRR